jgi:hypothetical protein
MEHGDLRSIKTIFQKIATVLNEEDIKTRLGKNWTATGVKNVIDKKWIIRR